MAGDFNINLLSTNDTVTREYADLLADFQLTQHIKDPTRISGSSATLIDHIISTSSLTVSNVYQASGISDHRMQVANFSISLMKCLPRSVWVRSFKKCDWIELRATLCSAPWHLMDLFHDLNDK